MYAEGLTLTSEKFKAETTPVLRFRKVLYCKVKILCVLPAPVPADIRRKRSQESSVHCASLCEPWRIQAAQEA